MLSSYVPLIGYPNGVFKCCEHVIWDLDLAKCVCAQTTVDCCWHYSNRSYMLCYVMLCYNNYFISFFLSGGGIQSRDPAKESKTRLRKRPLYLCAISPLVDLITRTLIVRNRMCLDHGCLDHGCPVSGSQLYIVKQKITQCKKTH